MKKFLSNSPKVLKIIVFQIMFINSKGLLYGLKQAPRAWYERLKTFILKNNFKIGKIDSTFLLMPKEEKDRLFCIF